MPSPLSKITYSDLAPLWSRREIPITRIALALGVSRNALSSKAKRLGLPSRKGNQQPNRKAPDAELKRLWDAGVKVADIAAELGYSSSAALSKRVAVIGLPRRQPQPGGGLWEYFYSRVPRSTSLGGNEKGGRWARSMTEFIGMLAAIVGGAYLIFYSIMLISDKFALFRGLEGAALGLLFAGVGAWIWMAGAIFFFAG